MKPDEIIKLNKGRENHPSFINSRICPKCGGAIIGGDMDAWEDVEFSSFCEMCINYMASRPEPTVVEIPEYRKLLNSCNACRREPRISRSDVCASCNDVRIKLLGGKNA